MKLLQTLVTKYKEAQQKSQNRKVFREALIQAVSDGKLTKEEIDDLEKMKKELELTEDDVRNMRVEMFTTAFEAAKADEKVTKEEEDELLHIRKYLGIEDADIEHTKKELARLRLLNEIQNGNMPALAPLNNLVMAKTEKAYWVEPASLVEEKVISRRHQGGSSGVSFRVMKGVRYHVGSSRGHITTQTGMVPVSRGRVIITSNRIIFSGDAKSFATKLDNILDIQLFTNGIHLSENNKSKPRLIKFQEEGNHDIIGGILTYAINHYGEKSNDKATS